MSGTAAALVFGLLLATAYGAGFHILLGGPPRRLVLYILAAWTGFALGHIVGDLFNNPVLKLGAVQLLFASVGAWIALVFTRWLQQSA